MASSPALPGRQTDQPAEDDDVRPSAPLSDRSLPAADRYASDDDDESDDGTSTSAKTGHRRQHSDAPLLPSKGLDADGERTATKLYGIDTERLRRFWQQNTGLLLVAFASMWTAGMAAAVAFLSQLPEAAISTSELIATRMSITALCCHTWLRWSGDPHPLLGPPGIRLLLVVRGVVGFFGLAGLYYDLRFLPLSDSVCLTFLAPAETGIIAAFVLGDPYRAVEAIAALVSLSGVVLIAKPSALFGQHANSEPLIVNGREVTDKDRLVAVAIGLVGTLGAAGAYIMMRVIGKRANPLHTIQYFSIWSTILAVIAPLVFRDQAWSMPKNPHFAALMLLIGALGFASQACLTAGLARERPGRGSLATFLQMPFAMVMEKIIFGRTMDVLSFLGAFIIVASALFVLLTKPKADTEVGSRLRTTSFSSTFAEAAMEHGTDGDYLPRENAATHIAVIPQGGAPTRRVD